LEYDQYYKKTLMSKFNEDSRVKILKSLLEINYKNGSTTKFVDVKDGKYWQTIDV